MLCSYDYSVGNKSAFRGKAGAFETALVARVSTFQGSFALGFASNVKAIVAAVHLGQMFTVGQPFLHSLLALNLERTHLLEAKGVFQ